MVLLFRVLVVLVLLEALSACLKWFWVESICASEHVHDAEEEADPTDRLSDHTAAEPLEAAEREEETENDAGGEPTEPSSKKHRAGPS